MKDALGAVYDVVFFLFWVTCRIENTFWVIFRPRGCSGVLYFVLEKDYTVTWNQRRFSNHSTL